ncbi:hypothetical protein FGB62_148g00 [Gracilaria domingensis]|nr:hypothetical protein FGB62_148g00 [Gracilaria domingensis]
MSHKRTAPRLTESSAAVKRLRQMFRAGELTEDENDSEVKNMDPLFKQYKSTTFRLSFASYYFVWHLPDGVLEPAAAIFVARTTEEEEV